MRRYDNVKRLSDMDEGALTAYNKIYANYSVRVVWNIDGLKRKFWRLVKRFDANKSQYNHFFRVQSYWRTSYTSVEWILPMMLWVNNLIPHNLVVGMKTMKHMYVMFEIIILKFKWYQFVYSPISFCIKCTHTHIRSTHIYTNSHTYIHYPHINRQSNTHTQSQIDTTMEPKDTRSKVIAHSKSRGQSKHIGRLGCSLDTFFILNILVICDQPPCTLLYQLPSLDSQ